MSDAPKTTPLHGSDTEQAVADMLCKLRAIFAEREVANPTPDPPPDPWVDKPGPLIAAEKEVAQWELVEKLQLAWCARPRGCRLGRCKRARRCAELERLRPMMEQSRAALAAARARWTPPAELGEPPARRRRRGGDQRAQPASP